MTHVLMQTTAAPGGVLASWAILVAEFGAVMADPIGSPSEAQCRAVAEDRAAQLPMGPEVWAIWHLPHDASVATLCEFDGCVCYECYADPADALAAASRLNADGYSASGRYIVARLPRGVAADIEGVGQICASGPVIAWASGMNCGFVTCTAGAADLDVFAGAPAASSLMVPQPVQQQQANARPLALDPTADPIHVAIERHRAAYAAYRHAPSLITNDDVDAATDSLVATVCTTRFGALALLDHLRWWIREEAEFAAGHQPAYGLAQARAADLTLFLGTNLPPVAIPRALPSGRLLPAPDRQHRHAAVAMPDEALPGEGEAWAAIVPVRPDTAHVRAPRFLDLAGELLAAAAVIGGGMVLTGLATLL